jgi:hypothetical protein
VRGLPPKLCAGLLNPHRLLRAHVTRPQPC